MKKFVTVTTALACAAMLTACGSVLVTPDIALPADWNNAAKSVYEHAEYKIERIAKPKDGDSFNPSVDPDNKDSRIVATGTQTITITNADPAKHKNCLELVTETHLDYTHAADGTEKSSSSDTYSKVVFLSGGSNTLETQYAEKRIVSSYDPLVNLDYTADYGDGLTVTSYELNDKGERVKDDDGKEKTNVYSYKAKEIKNNVYDNDEWLILTRFGKGLKEDWTSSFSLASIPDTIYQNQLSVFRLQAKAASEKTRRTFSALKENFTVPGEDKPFAEETVAAGKTMYGADCYDITLSNPGALGVARGPVIRASFISGRANADMSRHLTNLLVQYVQTEYYGKDVAFTTISRLSGATITKA